MEDKLIAVVDDDKINLQITGSVLKEKNMRICAFRSGEAFLRFIKENSNIPDLVLMDVVMPEMDGLETIERLKRISDRAKSIPVIFLTGDEDKATEKRGFDIGAEDFIRKPFDPEILIQRIERVLKNHQKIQGLEEKVQTDLLTGFLNKVSSNNKLREVCETETGTLLIMDLDSFKLVNDIYGHEAGDKILLKMAELLRRLSGKDDILGRIGGDEFIEFKPAMTDENVIKRFHYELNKGLTDYAGELLGEELNIPLGISAGGVFVPRYGTDYEVLFGLADKALYTSKQGGKHIYTLYSNSYITDSEELVPSNIHNISMVLDERNTSDRAMWMNQDEFSSIYRFMLRYIKSYNASAYKILFTVMPKNSAMTPKDMERVMKDFGEVVNRSLRKSDIMMQNKLNQFFLLLPELGEQYLESVISRILNAWNRDEAAAGVDVYYTAELISGNDEEGGSRRGDRGDNL